MARETRRQRRDQRKSSGAPKPSAQLAGASASNSQPQVRPSTQPPSTQTGRREPRQRGRFIRESWAELQKVEWPGQNQVIQGTIVVLVACAVVGAFLYVNDAIWKQVVQKVFLGQ